LSIAHVSFRWRHFAVLGFHGKDTSSRPWARPGHEQRIAGLDRAGSPVSIPSLAAASELIDLDSYW